MADCDLEDGELLDSDNEDPIQSGAQAQVPPPVTHAASVQKYRNPTIYRDRSQTVMSSSNSDDDSDEEKFLWKRKRLKYVAAKERDGSRDGKIDTADQGNFVGNWPPTSKSSGFPSTDILKPKKKKDIWGAVLQEQTLSQGFIGFDMEHKSDTYNDRNVEAYSFQKAVKDTRPWYNPVNDDEETETKSSDPFSGPPDLDKLEEDFVGTRRQGVKRKHSVKERLGPRQYNKRKSRDHYKVTASDPVDDVAEAVAERLQEPKVDLILRVVRTMGRKKTLELAYITEDIEDSGGMLINDGSRRRTPGGVFFQILKSDPSFSKDKMKAIFGDEMKKDAKRKKKLRAKRFKASLQKTMDVTGDGEDANEMDTAAADVSVSLAKDDAPLDKNNHSDEDCDDDDDDNSKDTSRGSSDTSNCPDPATMDLSELLKHHVERRSIEEKNTAEQKEASTENPPMEMQTKQQAPILEADIFLDDEADMTFDL